MKENKLDVIVLATFLVLCTMNCYNLTFAAKQQKNTLDPIANSGIQGFLFLRFFVA
ncbi:hypothetical protein F3D3_1894 [Fusibacter sp. 3D3]|nr:hypothetical protein F3D3_1894 [Fusibacter sp. 3D3]